ncbi:hypothetical protein E2C01_047129 [Portunus trituberculatus]|uniref:Uncharacterized protein n=1 Tax=Portunus trituberculatus TaxID=210409 RepID=A0A5B7FZL1_PORTR|nr:hypothetical protein [Portunus trituberculatus]
MQLYILPFLFTTELHIFPSLTNNKSTCPCDLMPLPCLSQCISEPDSDGCGGGGGDVGQPAAIWLLCSPTLL